MSFEPHAHIVSMVFVCVGFLKIFRTAVGHTVDTHRMEFTLNTVEFFEREKEEGDEDETKKK